MAVGQVPRADRGASSIGGEVAPSVRVTLETCGPLVRMRRYSAYVQHGRRIATTAGGLLGCVIASVGFLATLLVVCAGVWTVFWPVNYLGCGIERPAGITARDLVGSYAADDGARLDLERDGTFTASSLDNSGVFRARPPLSGSGTWALRPEDSRFRDIRMSLDSAPEDEGGYVHGLYVSGSRDDPWLYRYLSDPDTCALYRLDRV